MTFDKWLRRVVIYHLIGGILLSVTVFSLSLLLRYERVLNDRIRRLEVLKTKASEIRVTIDKITENIGKVKGLLPADYHKRSNRELMTISLDRIKGRIKGVEITLSQFKEDNGRLKLPLDIAFPLQSYREMIENIGFLQSLRFPYFTIDRVTIGRESDNSDVSCKITGSLVTPSDAY